MLLSVSQEVLDHASVVIFFADENWCVLLVRMFFSVVCLATVLISWELVIRKNLCLDLSLGPPGNLTIDVNDEITRRISPQRVLFHIREVSRVVVQLIHEQQVVVVKAVG